MIVERLSCHPSLLDPEESPHESTQIRMFALSCMKGSQACSDAALLVKKAALLVCMQKIKPKCVILLIQLRCNSLQNHDLSRALQLKLA